jgi:hypothetical protein
MALSTDLIKTSGLLVIVRQLFLLTVAAETTNSIYIYTYEYIRNHALSPKG